MYYIGIDLGTSSLKSFLIDESNNVLKSVTKDYPLYYPKDGYVEQDPKDWWISSFEAIKELTVDIDTDKLFSIGIAGQMHGLVALDCNGEVIRNAILWNDTRTKEEVNFLNNKLGKEYLSKNTGNIAYAGFTLPKILWMRKNEPGNYKKIKHILLPKDYISYKLTGKFATDYSDASGTLLLDVENKEWSKTLCEELDIDMSWLPELHESFEIVGNIKKEIKDELGLTGSTNVVAGAGDNAAAAISVSAINENSCNISLGTSGTIFIPTDNFTREKDYGLHSFVHATGNYHLMGCTLSAASSLKWWMEDVLKSKNYSKNQKDIENLGKNKVFFMPYLNGERSPHNDEDIKGGFLGLSASTTRADMTQAVLEGVAFSLRDCLECANKLGIYPDKATIVGGGSKSDLWCKIIANILRIPICRVESENGPGLGAAILARYANEKGESLEKISRVNKDNIRVFRPEDKLVDLYNNSYKKYKSLYPMLKEFYR